jgi:hypothetical protein
MSKKKTEQKELNIPFLLPSPPYPSPTPLPLPPNQTFLPTISSISPTEFTTWVNFYSPNNCFSGHGQVSRKSEIIIAFRRAGLIVRRLRDIRKGYKKETGGR